MRKFKFLTVILSLMVFLGSFAACSFTTGSTHTCESVCEVCEKCTNEECKKKACKEKCACEEDPVPEHTCESVCPECGGCMNADCEEEACENKCECEEAPAPEHECESVCEECGGCTNADCEEDVCADKCECEEEPAPEHECESVCEECGGCTNADCEEEACEEKCECETPAEHECENACEVCGKCMNEACEEDVCEEKCDCETPAEHECENACEVCGKCMNEACTDTACANKCQGHKHTCESKCELCGKCKDAECTEEACENKCEGHTVNDDWDTIELSFMSFNINYSNSDPKDDVDATGWTQRKEHVLNFVNSSGAHVIGLQEIAEWKSDLQNQRIYFEENLASKYELVYFSGNVKLATVYDKEVFNLLSTEQYWYSDTPDEVSTGWDGLNYRSATILMLEHRITGEIVKAINTHGPLSETGNVKAFEYLAERSLSDENDTFTVVLGDFNATPNKLGYVPVAEKLQDCRYVAEESPNRDNRTWNGYTETASGVLDYCFVSTFDNVKVLSYQVRDDKRGEGNYLSDHFAVQATVRIYNDSENAWTGFH